MVELGADVLAEEARASYEDGVLEVEVPLAPREEQARTVPIEAPEQERGLPGGKPAT